MKKHLETLAVALIAGAISAGAIVTLLSARADQSERVVPTAGIYTGPEYAQLIGNMARSISSKNKGATAPANVGGVAVEGLEWLDDSGSPYVEKVYINGGWAAVRAFDPTTSTHIGYLGGGLGSINSASVTNLGAVQQANVQILGTTPIGSFGSAAPEGAIKVVRFAGVLTLTWSSALPVPCGYDLVTAANDRAIVTHLGSGNWEFTSYQRASGIPIDCEAVAKLEMTQQALAPSGLYLPADGRAISRASYPAYVAKATIAQNGTRTNGNATITLANTDGAAVGNPVEGTGIGAGCTIANLVANTSITLNSSACVTSSGTSTVTIFPTGYGSGGSGSTIGLADCQGRAIAGMDGGTGRLTSSYFGAYANAINVPGGNEKVTMALANIYAHNHAVFLNDPGHSHLETAASAAVSTTNFQDVAHFAAGPNSGSVQNQVLSTNSSTTGISVRSASGGGGTANQTADAGSASPTPMATVSPMLTARCRVRVIP